MVTARDGHRNYVKSNLPSSKQKQSSTEASSFKKVKKKLKRVLDRRYITLVDDVRFLTHFFLIPKTWKVVDGKQVPDDIRMVYDATRSGLNQAVWTPWFPMPTIISHLRSVVAGTFMSDCNVGEMFLNFMLEPKLRPFAGVDLTCLFLEDISAENAVIRGCWERMLMGLSPSPYWMTKDLMEVEMMIQGNRRTPGIFFGWKRVVLNLPGTLRYNQSMLCVYKVGVNDNIVLDVYFYVDDGRPTAGSANLIGEQPNGCGSCFVSWDCKTLAGKGLPQVNNLGSGQELRWIQQRVWSRSSFRRISERRVR